MKKYTSGSFTATKYAIYKEDTDTITTFPAEIIADGENASAIVYGNMQQTGTPTPTTPITPSECGDLETTGEHSGQYKIPIESANTTTNIYIGEVQTTRRIKKLVLTGEETITQRSTPAHTFSMNYATNHYESGVLRQGLCSHFKGTQNVDNMENGDCFFGATALSMRYDMADTETDFKTYLAQQYANGTPVCVWYVLATETTGIVNEPLRKIGEYADTITATIPTIAAADNINVTTTLKPSAVYLTYTGWHRYEDKEYSGGGWGVNILATNKKSILGV